MRVVVDGLGGDDLARLETRDLGGEARLVGLREAERAGREIERGEAVGRATVAAAHPLHGDQQAGPARLEKALLGDRAGRDEPHDMRFTTDFAPRFLAPPGPRAARRRRRGGRARSAG